MSLDRDSIAAFYQRYPYPRVDQIEFDHNLFDHALYLAHVCRENPAPRRGKATGRMLVAGCGTREAVMWGLSLPHFQVDAIDVSEASLAIAETLAAQLGLKNLCFRQGDFSRGEGVEGPYDFISSYGVLHHLESPETGLAELEKHLAPHGTMALMVYSHTNRAAFQRAQRAIRLLAGNDADGERLENVGIDLCRTAAEQPGHLQPVLKAALEDYRRNREHFADTMINPRERSYTVPELARFLATAGMEPVAPMQPEQWDVSRFLSPGLRADLARIPLLHRLELADLLIGPLFWILARRSSERVETRPCAGDRTLFWRIVPQPLSTGTWPVRELVVGPEFHPVRVEIRDIDEHRVELHRNSRYPRVLHPIAWRMFSLLNGERSLGEAARRAASEMGVPFAPIEDSLEEMARVLMDEMAALSPDVTRCRGCYRRDGNTGSPVDRRIT